MINWVPAIEYQDQLSPTLSSAYHGRPLEATQKIEKSPPPHPRPLNTRIICGLLSLIKMINWVPAIEYRGQLGVNR